MRWFLPFLFLLFAPFVAQADGWVFDRPLYYLGACPVYVNGIEIGQVFAEPFGMVPPDGISFREYAIFFRALNRTNFEDRLIDASTPIAENIALKQFFTPPQGGQNYSAPVEFFRLPDARQVIDSDRTRFLYLVEWQPGDKFLHVQNVRAPVPYGSSLPIRLEFQRAGPVIVQAFVRPPARPGKDRVFPSCL